MTTGRIVPRDLLVKALEQVPRSVAKLSPLVDYTAELHNAPHADDIQLVAPHDETWDSFKEQWSQTCAWEPKHIAQTKLGGKQLTKSPPSSERLTTNQNAAKSEAWPCESKYIAEQECDVQPLTKTPQSSDQLQQVAIAQRVAAPDSDSCNICNGDGDGTASEAETATSASAAATVSVSSSS
jgi:hypothetical protein